MERIHPRADGDAAAPAAGHVADPARPVPLGRPLTGPTSYVWAVAFSPDGKTLAAGVTDGTVWRGPAAHPAGVGHLRARPGLPRTLLTRAR